MSKAAKIWDSFPEGQTMSRSEFCRRYKEAIDQKTMQRDLGQILAGRREKELIDRAVRGQD